MSDTDRAISRLFVPRKDGFDYYPFGFKRSGYPADGTLFEDSTTIERSGSRFALIGVGLIALLLYVILPNLAEVHPALIPLANSPIIRLTIALPLVALVYLAVMLRRRALLSQLLAGRAATSLPLSPQAILIRRAENWRMIPWFSRVAMFIAVPLAALAMALYAGQRMDQAGPLAPWEASLAVLFALALVALFGFLVYRAMSFRGVN
jgi:hypothetical protein